ASKHTTHQSQTVAYATAKSNLDYEMPEPRRFVAHHKLDAFTFSPHSPVNTLQIMRGAVAAEAEGVLAAYDEAVFQHMWERPKKMDDPEVIRAALTESGLDAERLLARTQDPRVKDALAA